MKLQAKIFEMQVLTCRIGKRIERKCFNLMCVVRLIIKISTVAVRCAVFAFGLATTKPRTPPVLDRILYAFLHRSDIADHRRGIAEPSLVSEGSATPDEDTR